MRHEWGRRGEEEEREDEEEDEEVEEMEVETEVVYLTMRAFLIWHEDGDLMMRNPIV